MVYKVFGAQNADLVKAQVAAKYAGVELEAHPAEEAKNAHGRFPVLETDNGVISEANAILRYIARVGGAHLYGKNDFEAGLVDQWIDFSASAIELPALAWTLPLEGAIPNNGLATKKAQEDIKKVFQILDSHLLTRTYLVGNRVSIADIAVAVSLIRLFELVLDPTFRSSFVNATRWFVTIVNQPNFLAVRSAVVLADKVAQPPKQEKPKKEEKPKQEKPAKQEKPKKEEKPAAPAADEEEDDAPKEEKKKNPLDDLPKSNFVLDEWKRKYSNSDTRSEALPWFFEHFDPTGYSVFWTKYKYNDELKGASYLVSNLVGGFFQRLESLHKYAFGTLNIYGSEDGWEIHGVWVFRGPGIPAGMTECDDSEVYDFTPADLSDPAQKAQFGDYLAWEGSVNGKAFSTGKVFK